MLLTVFITVHIHYLDISITVFITVKEYLWKKINVGNYEIFSQEERKNILEKVKNFYKNIMQDLLDEIKMKIKTMQATLIQLNEYEIHHESVNIIRKEMNFYQHIAEHLESEMSKNGKL